jgi:hypothetical protein
VKPCWSVSLLVCCLSEKIILIRRSVISVHVLSYFWTGNQCSRIAHGWSCQWMSPDCQLLYNISLAIYMHLYIMRYYVYQLCMDYFVMCWNEKDWKVRLRLLFAKEMSTGFYSVQCSAIFLPNTNMSFQVTTNGLILIDADWQARNCDISWFTWYL